MDTLHIRQFTARYRLSKLAHAERERLDKVLTTVLEDVLEQALHRAGISVHEEVCIRQLTVPVRLRLSKADSALALAWSLRLAETIKQAANEDPHSGLVRYGSRVHALIDLAASLAKGNYSRIWAWKQLGLWRASERPGDREAVRELVRTLCAESTLIMPVLGALADQHVLVPLASRFTAGQWLGLAQAALSAVGSSLRLTESVQFDEQASHFVRQAAHRLIDVSRLALTLADLAAASAEIARAVAALVVLEEDPGALRTSGNASQALISTVARALAIVAAVAAAQTTATESASENERSQEGLSHGEEARERDLTRSVSLREITLPDHPSPSERPAASVPDEAPIPVVRRRAITRFGGLLFLLGIVDDLDLPAAIRTHPALCERRFRWVLHQLALAVVPAEPHDPAVLAFAGLLPDANPPSLAEDPPNNEEQGAMAVLAARIRDTLCERLNRPDRAKVLQFVCQRRAAIVADPGWIEVRLSLDEVSTEIRRVGLDLDPDYVPWLGVVVRFVYE